MNKKSLIVFVFALLSVIHYSEASLVGICDAILIDDDSLFNVCPFEQTTDFPMPFNISAANYTSNMTLLKNVNYTLTMSLVNANAPGCNYTGDGQVFATITNTTNTSAYNTTNCWEIAVDNPTITALDSSDEEEGLLFTFPSNPASPVNISLFVQLSCDSSASSASETNFTVISVNSTTIIVSGSSYYGCPYVSLGMLENFLEKYKYVFVGIFIILGFFTCFFGTQMMKACIFIITAVGGAMISGSLFFEFTHLSTEEWTLWLIFAVCVIIGCVLGYVAIKIETIGFVALGLVLGAVGGLVLYNAVLAPFLSGKQVVLYVSVGVLAIIGGALAFKFWKYIVLISTAVIGSFMIIRSIAVPIGGFPSEESIAQGISGFQATAYAYLAGFLVLAAAGGFVQWRRSKRLYELNEEDPHGYESVMNSVY